MKARARLPLAAAVAALALLCGCGVTEPLLPVPAAVTPPPPGTAGKAAGEVWTAGDNSAGQLGRVTAKTADPALGPAVGPDGRNRLGGVAAVAGGDRHSLAILAGRRVVAWGANDRGQLGDGTRAGRKTPAPVPAPGGSGPLTGVTAIAADTDFSVALLRNGTVVTWGTGDAGQRGIGRLAAPALPTVVRAPDGRGPLTGVTAVAVEGRTVLALLKDGTVLGWGANEYGMIGDGTTADRLLPVPVRGPGGAPRLTGVTHIALGGRHGLARLRNGTAVAWGRNDYGQLGDGTRRDRPLPAPVTGPYGLPVLRNVVAVSAGDRHNYALRNDGTAVAWGENMAGQLGNDSVEDSPRPVQVAGVREARLRGIAEIHAAESYGVALLTDGTALSWGSGGKGQLGSGVLKARGRPGPVVMAGGRPPTGRIVGVGAGRRHLQLLLRR